MRIAMIFRKLNVKGGTQRQGLSLARELKKMGHDIKIYTLNLDREKCYPELLNLFEVKTLKDNEKDAPYYPMFLTKIGVTEVSKENKLAQDLAEIMDDNFDLLNPHDQVSYKVAYYYKKQKKNIPAVWNMNDLPLKQWGYARMKGCDERFHQPWYRHLAYKLFDFYDKHKFIKHMDKIVVVDFFNRELVKKYLGLKADTVRSGPDFEHFIFEAKSHPGKKMKILTSGILMPHRRFEDTIAALPILQKRGYSPTLTIIGDTNNDKKYFARLGTLVEELNLKNVVKFTGRVSEEDLVKSYQTHDLYIFQHHLQSDGLSSFEAAACGMPFIVSKTAGCHEVLTHGENALLIEAKNPDDIADKVEQLIKDPELYAKLAKNAHAFVHENFSWPKYAKGVLDIMELALRKYE
ncbi:MAG TPA: glycosyltransferase family 4 protein [Candidatus Paceibacterota bacterium]